MRLKNLDKKLEDNKPALEVDADYGFLKLYTPPSLEQLQIHYQELYFQNNYGNYRRRYSSEEIHSLERQVQRSLSFLGIDNGNGQNALDLGCGEGFAGAALQKMGFSVSLVDYSSAGLLAQNPSLEDQSMTADLMQFLEETPRVFDVVWCSHVIEHVLDPKKFMRALQRVLHEASTLVITVPNDGSRYQEFLLSQGYVQHRWWVSPPDHISYFNRESFIRLAEGCGYSVESVWASMPIDWFLLNQASNYVEDKSLGQKAYFATLALERFLDDGELEKQFQLRSAIAEAGLGRDLTFVLHKVEDVGQTREGYQ